MKLRRILLTFCFTVGLSAQAPQQMNVQQLADFLRSELALRQHTDKQIAAYLKKIELSEKLPEKTITDLEAQGAGSKTVEALRAMREHTASAKKAGAPDATYSPATAPDTTLTQKPPSASLSAQPVAPPPPDSVHQQAILDLMKQYAMTYAQGLPNYVCVRVDRRYMDPRGGDSYRSLGTVLAKVSFNEGQEHYEVYSEGGRLVGADVGGLGGGGARSSGEFAAMMRSLFDPKSSSEFGWDHWAKLRGRTMAVFNYFIDSGHSSYTIDYGSGREDDQRIITAYKGLVYADANTGEIDRITFSAVDIPSSFPVRKADELVDYDLVNIGGQQSVLPIRALLHMRTLRETSKNEIEFRNYRKFGTEFKINYDMEASAEPLPASKTEEQSVTGSSAKPAASQQTPKTPAKSAASTSNPWTLPEAPPPPPPQQ